MSCEHSTHHCICQRVLLSWWQLPLQAAGRFINQSVTLPHLNNVRFDCLYAGGVAVCSNLVHAVV